VSTRTTLAALQSLHNALPEVMTAPDAYPVSLEAADLPCVISDVGPGMTRWDAHGGDLKRTERTYIIRWYASLVALGEGINEGKQSAIDLLDTALALYDDTDDLSNGAQIRISDDDRQAIRDSGILHSLMYGDSGPFRGFEIQISVWEWS
jgi:hypothetical protein